MKLLNISNDGRKIYLFCRDDKGNQIIKEKTGFFPYYFEKHPDGTYNSIFGDSLKKMFGSKPRDIPKMRQNDSFESDILFCKRYIIDKIDKIEKCPIKFAMIDIEVEAEEMPDPNEAKYPISCISIYNSFTKKVKTFSLFDYDTEYEMLEEFCAYLKKEAFDLWLSWNVSFDYNYCYHRIEDFSKKISPIGQDRYADGKIFYPSGTAIVDYLSWDKKITQNKRFSYTLDYVAQEVLKIEPRKKVEFGKLTPEIYEKNIEDVQLMAQIEEKKQYISYHNEIRILTQVEWEDFTYYSRLIDMLLLKEAKNQKMVLPMKPSEERGTLEEKYEYSGAYRDILYTGSYFGVSSYDISSAYPSMIIDFNIDVTNLNDSEGIKLTIQDLVKDKDNKLQYNSDHSLKTKEGNTYYYKQNSQTLLPIVAKKLLKMKGEVKDKLKSLQINSPEYNELKITYSAIKAITNSLYGNCGSRYFRLCSEPVAETITFLVRDFLDYVVVEIHKKGYKVLYLDTDGIMLDTEKDLTDLLNQLAKEWGLKYGKKNLTINFDYEGIYDSIFLATRCRYKGYLRTDKGLEPIEKGLELKRKDCFDGKTLILTDKGWKYFKDLTYSDKVLSMNPETNIANYYPIKKIIKEKYEGEMYWYSDQSIDFCVTPNHKFLQRTYQYKKTEKAKFKTIKKIKQDKTVFTSQKHYIWGCEDSNNEFMLSGIVNKQYIELFIPMDNWFQFVGWYLSEGYVYIDESKKIYEIFIGQSIKNKTKRKILKQLLKNLSVYFFENDRGFQIKNKLIAYELKKYGNNAKNKFIPYYIKNASDYHIKHFLHTYHLGDGWYKGKVKQRLFSTSSKQMAYDLQELLTKIGKSSTLLPIKVNPIKKWIVDHWANVGGIYYQISESSTKYFHITPNKIKKKKYKGTIYCVEVEPYHTIYVMRNGKSYWSGNSTTYMRKFQTELIDKIIKTREEKKDIIIWIKTEIKNFKKQPLQNIAFPCKLARKIEEYKNLPIFARAIQETEGFNPRIGENFYYVYVKPEYYYEEKKVIDYYKEVPGKREGTTKKQKLKVSELKKLGEIKLKIALEKGEIKRQERVQKTKKARDVKAFNESTGNTIEDVNWTRMLERNIINKLETIFEAMGWDMKEIRPDISSTVPKINPELAQIGKIKPKAISILKESKKEAKTVEIKEIKPYYEE